MSTTAPAPTEAACEHPNKRRRDEADALSSLDDNCTFSILSFLRHPDLNSFAACSRRCRKARSSPLLDQTRTGTIVCSENPSILELYNAFDVGRWNNALYSGNRTHLRVVGFERLGLAYANYEQEGLELLVHGYARRTGNVQLTGVTKLDLSCSPQDGNRLAWPFVSYVPCYALARILPNLQELDLSYLGRTHHAIQVFCRECPNLTRVTWKGPHNQLNADGFEFQNAANLTELNLDGTRLNRRSTDREESSFETEVQTDDSDRNPYMWMHFKNLKRLSMKNTAWYTCHYHNFGPTSGDEPPQPISQAMIIKLVRHHPSLRWLRSDLTQENIATLQQERPDITFVID